MSSNEIKMNKIVVQFCVCLILKVAGVQLAGLNSSYHWADRCGTLWNIVFNVRSLLTITDSLILCM